MELNNLLKITLSLKLLSSTSSYSHVSGGLGGGGEGKSGGFPDTPLWTVLY